MADAKISALNALTTADDADLFAVVDTSATETKKITKANLLSPIVISGANVGIGTASPKSAAGYSWLTINGASAGGIVSLSNADTELGRLQSTNLATTLITLTAAPLVFKTNNAESMRISSAGLVGIGTSSPSEKVSVVGNVTISGSLSKGSGSFRIDHPVKPDTHYLVHSFVEAPTADNIYRGTVALVDGVAKVDLDTAARLTAGTFEALNTNVDCWVSNKTGWTAVRATVSGSTLSIQAEVKTCTDIVSWLVIGERHDQTIIDANWTDESGRVITEPEKDK